MHLIQGTMNASLPSLPQVLSPALYASALSLPAAAASPTPASRILPTSPLRQQSTGGYGGARTLSPQITGTSFSQSQQFSPQQASFPTPFGQPQGLAAWDVSAKEKAEADRYFVGLDPSGKGVVEGEMALPFMMASGLAVETLALVWCVSAPVARTLTLD